MAIDEVVDRRDHHATAGHIPQRHGERPEWQAILKVVSIDRAKEKKKSLEAAEANKTRVKAD